MLPVLVCGGMEEVCMGPRGDESPLGLQVEYCSVLPRRAPQLIVQFVTLYCQEFGLCSYELCDYTVRVNSVFAFWSETLTGSLTA